MYFVYELIDPRTNTTGYIGMTNNPNLRYQQHLEKSEHYTQKDIWIQQILAEQVRPKMKIIEVVDDRKQAKERETYWIRQYIAQQVPLTNIRQREKKAQPATYRNIATNKRNMRDQWFNTLQACSFCKIPWKGTQFLYLAEEFGLTKREENNTTYYRRSELEQFILWLDKQHPGIRYLESEI